MKNILLRIFVAIIVLFVSNEVSAKQSNEFLNLTDTVVFDLSTATYSNSGGVYYIDIPVLIYSNDPGINALDFWFHFDLSKMTYVSTVSLEAGLDPFTNYNVNSQVLSNTTSGTSIAYSAPTYSELLILRFSLTNACTDILPSDFSAITALVNGNLSSYLFVPPHPIPPFTIQQPQPYCSGSDIVFNYPLTTVNGRNIQSYAWDFGNGQTSALQSDTAVYAAEGNYPVVLTLTTVDGCVYPIQNEVPIYPTPVAAFSSSWDEPTNVVSFTNESTITSGSINLLAWDFGSSTSNLQNPNYTFPIPGYYNVTLTATSDLGCTSSITQLVTAIDIVELENRSFRIFPIPASDMIQVESSVHAVVRITDVTGRIISENYILQGNQTTNINVSSLANGYYFLESVGNDVVMRERFLIEN